MKEIVVAVVQHKNKILILKRILNKHFDPGKWEFVSGLINNERNLEHFAKKKILDETGLNAVFVKKGEQFIVRDQYGEWLIHPFLFTSNSKVVKLQKSHDTFKWIGLNELSQFDTVHELSKNLATLNL